MTTVIALALLASTLAYATPLLLAALGELVGERSGTLNIGLEGMMLCGAWAGAAASFMAKSGPVGLAAAMLAGMAMAAIFALLVINLRADAIVVGTGLNLFALGLTGTLHRAFGLRFGEYQSVALPQYLFTATAAIAALILWWGLHRTRSGLKLKAVGEYPAAAETAGVSVPRTRWLATLFNGALCGAAGAFLSMSQTDSFAENMTIGRGFIALTVVIFGRWSPLGAVGAALLFGAAEASQHYLQLKFNDNLYPLLLMLPYVITLLTLAGFAGNTRAPAALNVTE